MSHHGSIGAEMRSPETVGQDRGAIAAGDRLGLGESAAELRSAAERRKERWGHRERDELLGTAGFEKRHLAGGEERGLLDRGAGGAPVEIVGNRDVGVPSLLAAVPDEHEPSGIAVRQRAEDDLIEDAE